MYFTECKTGLYVYVYELDVFGYIRTLNAADKTVTVECDHPMPGYMWTGNPRPLPDRRRTGIRLASEATQCQ